MKRWLSIAVTLFFLFLLARKIAELGPDRILQSLKQIKVLYFIGGILLMVLSAFFQACRWSAILRPLGSFSPFQTFTSVTIGHWFNAVLPVRMGELARPFHFARKHHLPFITMLATTVIERIFDLLFVFTLAVISLMYIWAAADTSYIFVLIAVYVAGLICLFLFVRNEKAVISLTGRIANEDLKNNIEVLLQRFYEGIKLVNDVRQLARVAFFTLGVWLVNICSYWLLLNSCRLPQVLQHFASGVAVTLMGAVTHAIPSTASGLGVINYGIVVALEQYARSVSFDVAVLEDSIIAASIVIYVAALIPDILIGGLFYWRDKELFVGFKSKQ